MMYLWGSPLKVMQTTPPTAAEAACMVTDAVGDTTDIEDMAPATAEAGKVGTADAPKETERAAASLTGRMQGRENRKNSTVFWEDYPTDYPADYPADYPRETREKHPIRCRRRKS